jgi:hypothetical protein
LSGGHSICGELLSPHLLRHTLVAVRRFLTRRWLLTHALAIGLVVVFLIFGWWQLHRAENGHTASWAYTVEWPTFALMVVGFWIKIVRDELHPKAEQDGSAAPDAAPPAATASKRARARSRDRAERAAELAVYNRYLADRANQSGRPAPH